MAFEEVSSLVMADREIGERARSERLEAIASELRRRIRPVCPTMPEELFFEMIERMAVIQLKYELLEGPSHDY
ncbi:MAG: hypothetical protein ABJE10_16700 [bacterium]